VITWFLAKVIEVAINPRSLVVEAYPVASIVVLLASITILPATNCGVASMNPFVVAFDNLNGVVVLPDSKSAVL